LFNTNSQKSTGTEYTITAALLLVAFVFCPAVLLVSGPVGSGSIYLAIACSVVCTAMAWANWRWHSRLTIPSLEASRTKSK
jgi:TRAP-type uncharacterized transport system fused permease subunit